MNVMKETMGGIGATAAVAGIFWELGGVAKAALTGSWDYTYMIIGVAGPVLITVGLYVCFKINELIFEA